VDNPKLTFCRGDNLRKHINKTIFMVRGDEAVMKHYYEIGTTFLKKGDYDQAIFSFNKALEIDPKLIGAYFN
jgi:tetratricopeptide (TPR) repeat protein